MYQVTRVGNVSGDKGVVMYEVTRVGNVVGDRGE